MKVNKIEVEKIPFCELTGFVKSNLPEFLFMLEERPSLHNHLQTLHAGALFTLAESTSGQFLLNEFSHLEQNLVPVIRKAQIKYSKPGHGTAYSKATFVEQTNDEIETELCSRKKVIIKVRVDVFNKESIRLLTAYFDWFVAIQ